MQPEYEFTASLKVRHPDLDPALLTRELGLVPQYCWQAGQPRPAEAGDATDGTYRESYWLAKFHPLPLQPFAMFGTSPRQLVTLENVLWMGSLILKRHHELWTRLRREGATAHVLVVLTSHERFSLDLPSDLLSMMANLGLSVSVDVQPCLESAA